LSADDLAEARRVRQLANEMEMEAAERRYWERQGEAWGEYGAYQPFLKGFIPPDYLIDGILQRRFIYSLTAPTGGGKTAIAL
jgi:hypothetical protein